MILSCLFIFLTLCVCVIYLFFFLFCFVLFFYSEALLWFCYQSKFVERVSRPRGDWFISLFCLCLSIGHQCVSPAVLSLLSKVPWHAFVRGISYFEFDKPLDTNVTMDALFQLCFTFFKLKMFIHLYQILTALFFYTQKPGIHFRCYFSIVDILWFSQQ